MEAASNQNIKQSWCNYVVDSIATNLKTGHIPAENLKNIISSWGPVEGYHCMFDLEPRTDYASYKGNTKSALGYIWLDFDSDNDAGLSAKRDALAFVEKYFSDKLHELQIFFSGKKGFSLGIPSSYLPFPEMSEKLPRLVGAWAHSLKKEYPTLDAGIYNASRKFRIPGSKHPGTGLYKIPVNLHDGLDTIKLKAKDHVFVNVKPHAYKEGLVLDAWQSWVVDAGVRGSESSEYVNGPNADSFAPPYSQSLEYTHASVSGSVNADDPYQHFTNYKGKLCIKALLQDRCDPGGRHKTALVIISDMYHTGMHIKKATETMLEWGALNGMTKEGRGHELLGIIEKVYSGSVKYTFGCNTPEKSSKCSGKCPVFKNLSISNRPKVVDAPKLAEKKQKINEEEVASQVLERYAGRLVKQDKSLFGYADGYWTELNTSARDRLKNELSAECGLALDSSQVESLFKTLFRRVPEVEYGGAGVGERRNLFDPNPFCVNFLDGTLHIRQGADFEYHTEFLPHDPRDYVTNILPYEYLKARGAVNNEFMGMLDRIFEGDEDKAEKIRAIRQMYGACLAPTFPRFFMLWGVARSGKSTLIRLAEQLVTRSNLCSVGPHQFTGFNMESMVGKLVNTDPDIALNRPIAEDNVKKVIDRRLMRIRRKGIADAYGFIPGIHIFGGNSLPKLEGEASGAHERRWTFIEFKNVQGAGDRYNKEYWLEVWQAGEYGILQFALDGLDDLLKARGHYVNPASGREAMREWQESGDIVSEFLEAIKAHEVRAGGLKVIPSEGGRINRVKLYEVFIEWSGLRDKIMITRNEFYKRLRRKNLHCIESNGERFFGGIALDGGNDSVC